MIFDQQNMYLDKKTISGSTIDFFDFLSGLGLGAVYHFVDLVPCLQRSLFLIGLAESLRLGNDALGLRLSIIHELLGSFLCQRNINYRFKRHQSTIPLGRLRHTNDFHF